uniref:Uncharacterized protein n=1 Tax=uncultured marine virus TaxID=186617 RepID=A0A0F7L2Y6_9VIRU|nr:hypothetical protein [uncultured marine virus]
MNRPNPLIIGISGRFGLKSVLLPMLRRGLWGIHPSSIKSRPNSNAGSFAHEQEVFILSLHASRPREPGVVAQASVDLHSSALG